MTRILIVDDHPVMREGVRRVLERWPDLEVVAELGDATSLTATIERTPVDIVILDISMPGPDFLQVLDSLRRFPRVRTLILSAHPEEEFALRALRSGAAGYLEKHHSPAQLVEAVRRLAEGRRYISERLAEQLASGVQGGGTVPSHDELSEREFQVLTMIAGGRSLKEIGASLDINPKTVSSYRARIMAKLGFRSNADMVRYAMEHHLLEVAR